MTELNYSLAVPVELEHPGVLLHVVPSAVHLPPGLGRIRPLEEPERSLRQTQHGRQGEAVWKNTVILTILGNWNCVLLTNKILHNGRNIKDTATIQNLSN